MYLQYRLVGNKMNWKKIITQDQEIMILHMIKSKIEHNLIEWALLKEILISLWVKIVYQVQAQANMMITMNLVKIQQR